MGKEFKKTIKLGQEKEFKYGWKPTLFGKHLLEIDIFADDEFIEHIEKVINVNTDIIIEDKLAKVNLLWMQK